MIITKFNSIINKNNVKQQINNILSIQIKNDFDIIIDETIKYITSNISNEIPENMTEIEYLALINKKLMDIVVPIIKNKVNSVKKNKEEKEENKKKELAVNNERNNVENIFDPILMKNYKNSIPIIEYPKQSYDRKPNLELNKIEENRDELVPKMKPVDITRIQAQIQSFSKNEDKSKTLQMYNELLTSYSLPFNQRMDDDNGNGNGNSNSNNNDDNIEIDRRNFNKSLLMETPINQLTSNYNIGPEISNANELLLSSYSTQRNEGVSYHVNQIKEKNEESEKIKQPIYSSYNVPKKYYITFDSIYRDLDKYPVSNMFQYIFSEKNNDKTIDYRSYYDQYNTLILNEKSFFITNSNDINIKEKGKNIVSLSLLNAIVPIFHILNKDPYLSLVIPEIKGYYIGQNNITNDSFAKIVIDNTLNNPSENSHSFYHFKRGQDENCVYKVEWGKMDTLTFQLYDKDGQLYNSGIDKLYIKSFKSGSVKYNIHSGKSYVSTVFTIQNKHHEYANYFSYYSNDNNDNQTCLYNHFVQVSDKLYFYNTLPMENEIAFLEDIVFIHKIKYEKGEKGEEKTANIYICYKRIIEEKEKQVYVHLENIIDNGMIQNYYLVLFDKELEKYYSLQINRFEKNYVNVCISNLPKNIIYENLKIGISQKNRKGRKEDKKNSFFTKYGHTVLSVGKKENELFDIEIDYPFDNKLYEYPFDTIFFIQAKMQICYEFEMVVNE